MAGFNERSEYPQNTDFELVDGTKVYAAAGETIRINHVIVTRQSVNRAVTFKDSDDNVIYPLALTSQTTVLHLNAAFTNGFKAVTTGGINISVCKSAGGQ
jgi:hypothetical protein